MAPSKKPLILTIGHSTLTAEAFLQRLRAFGVQRLIDIRTIPRSRNNPQFNYDVLPRFLRNRGIGYRHLKGLGGLRHARKDSVNAGWENASFRGYADYMQTENFRQNLERLIKLAGEKQVAIMCAEAVPWRCHRSLVADALTVRGIPVRHIMSGSTARPHELTRFAQVRGTELTYPKTE